jgi:hypothetical protein
MSIDALDVAFAGIVLTALSIVIGYVDRRADRRHARELAHDEWLSVRRGDLYVDLLDYVYRMVAHVDHYSASQGKAAPSNDEARRMQARLTAYGSPEVAAAALEVIRGSLAIYGAMIAPSRPGETVVTTLDMSLAEVRDRQEALEALISAELASLPSAKA